MLGANTVVNPISFFIDIMRDINANNGTINCGYCALQLDLNLRERKRLPSPPVPIESANLHFFPQFKGEKIFRASTADERLLKRCLPTDQPPIRYVCNLENQTSEFVIDLQQGQSQHQQLRLHRTTTAEIITTLQDLPRRKSDNTAYGFILLTNESNPIKGHILNFYVGSDDLVYFLDAQTKNPADQIRLTLNMQGSREEIFFIPSYPPEGFKPKPEVQRSPLTLQTPGVSEAIRLAQERLQIHCSLSGADLNNSHTWLLLGINYNKKAGEKSPLFFHLATQCDAQNGEAWAQLSEFRSPNWKEHALKAYIYGNPSTRAYILDKLISYTIEQVKKDPNNVESWYQLGNGLLRSHRIDVIEAYKCFRYALMMKPRDERLWKALSECHLRGLGNANDTELAKACYENHNRKILKQRLAAFDLPEVEAPSLFHILKLTVGMPNALLLDQIPDTPAIEALKERLAKHPEDSNAWLQLGHLCYQNKKIKESYLCFIKTTEIDSTHAEALALLAYLNASGWPLLAKKALNLGHRTAKTCIKVGITMMYSKPSLAIDLFKEGLRKDPTIAHGWYCLAMSYLKSAELRVEGYRCLRHALSLKANSKDIWLELANYYSEEDQLKHQKIIDICRQNGELAEKDQSLLEVTFESIDKPTLLQEIPAPRVESSLPALVFSNLKPKAVSLNQCATAKTLCQIQPRNG